MNVVASTPNPAATDARKRDHAADAVTGGVDFAQLLQRHEASRNEAPEATENRRNAADEQGRSRTDGAESRRDARDGNAPRTDDRNQAPDSRQQRGERGESVRSADDRAAKGSEAKRPHAGAELEPDAALDVDDPAADVDGTTEDGPDVAAQTGRPAAAVATQPGAAQGASPVAGMSDGAIKLDATWRPVTIQAPEQVPEPDADPAEQARIRTQVLGSLRGVALGGTDTETIRLHLKPAHLGRVEIVLQRNGASLDVVLKVDSAAAEQALSEAADDIGQMLMGKGTSWSDVSVKVEAETEEEADEEKDADDGREDHEHERGNGADDEPSREERR